ncbi:hypothetical protein ABIB62_004274 [Mucilaginibacter sp. UYP25]
MAEKRLSGVVPHIDLAGTDMSEPASLNLFIITSGTIPLILTLILTRIKIKAAGEAGKPDKRLF